MARRHRDILDSTPPDPATNGRPCVQQRPRYGRRGYEPMVVLLLFELIHSELLEELGELLEGKRFLSGLKQRMPVNPHFLKLCVLHYNVVYSRSRFATGSAYAHLCTFWQLQHHFVFCHKLWHNSHYFKQLSQRIIIEEPCSLVILQDKT